MHFVSFVAINHLRGQHLQAAVWWSTFFVCQTNNRGYWFRDSRCTRTRLGSLSWPASRGGQDKFRTYRWNVRELIEPTARGDNASLRSLHRDPPLFDTDYASTMHARGCQTEWIVLFMFFPGSRQLVRDSNQIRTTFLGPPKWQNDFSDLQRFKYKISSGDISLDGTWKSTESSCTPRPSGLKRCTLFPISMVVDWGF